MSKKTIWAIVVLMSVALVGLAVIQVYWIRWSYNLEERRFDIKVKDSLDKISSRLDSENNFLSSPLSLSNNLKKSISFQSDSLISDVLPSLTQGANPLRGRSYYEMIQFRNIMNPLSLEERIDLKKLEKLISQEFKNKGLPDEYDYGVYSQKDSNFVIINGLYTVSDFNNDVSQTDISAENLF
ncbi:MAG: hypothetical protein AAGK97_12780, partial [Bacteroidota bacterium]